MSRRRSRVPEAPPIATQWSWVIGVLGVASLAVGALWWLFTPESERYYECDGWRGRGGCAETSGSLAGPAVALTLGLLLLAIAAAIAIEGRWRARAARRQNRPRSRSRGAGHRSV